MDRVLQGKVLGDVSVLDPIPYMILVYPCADNLFGHVGNDNCDRRGKMKMTLARDSMRIFEITHKKCMLGPNKVAFPLMEKCIHKKASMLLTSLLDVSLVHTF